MNAIDLLKQDHRTVDALFKKAEDQPAAKQATIFKKIKNELDTHAHMEETIFYPRLKKEGDKELVDIVLEGFEEHRQMKMFLGEIAALSPKDEAFSAKFKVLVEDTRHHVKEEENEMFPMVESQFKPAVLEKLGERMQTAKLKFHEKNNITPVRPEKGVVAKVLDMAGETLDAVLSAPQSSKAGGTNKGGGKSSASKGGAAGSSKSTAAKSTGSAATSGKAAGTAKSQSSTSSASSNRSTASSGKGTTSSGKNSGPSARNPASSGKRSASTGRSQASAAKSPASGKR